MGEGYPNHPGRYLNAPAAFLGRLSAPPKTPRRGFLSTGLDFHQGVSLLKFITGENDDEAIQR
jgi:hypothetical protein